MAGVNKLLKQAQRMQKKMEQVQQELAQQEIEVSSGGGAVIVKMSISGEVRGLKINPELLKEAPDFVESTLLEAFREAVQGAKKQNEARMGELTSGLSFPGLM
jgi:DNA-binding YbaB/EbfC family protein